VHHDVVLRGFESEVIRINRRAAQIFRGDRSSPKERVGDSTGCVGAVVNVQRANVWEFSGAFGNQCREWCASLVPPFAKMTVFDAVQIRGEQKLVDLRRPLSQLMRQRMARVRKIRRSKIDLKRDFKRHERKLPW